MSRVGGFRPGLWTPMTKLLQWVKRHRPAEWLLLWVKVTVAQSDSLQPHGLYSPWNSPGQTTGVGSRSLLQGIFPTQGLPHCRWILSQLSYVGWALTNHKTQMLVSTQLWRKKLSNSSAEPGHSEPWKAPWSRVRWQEFPAITKKSPSTLYVVPREQNKRFKFCHREKSQKSTLPAALGCGAAWAAGISWRLGWCCNIC